jgi:hypothetical protein
VSRPGDEENIQIVFDDHTIHVSVDEIETRRRSPVTKKAWLHVFDREWLLEERVCPKVYLSNRQIIRSSPVSVEEMK